MRWTVPELSVGMDGRSSTSGEADADADGAAVATGSLVGIAVLSGGAVEAVVVV